MQSDLKRPAGNYLALFHFRMMRKSEAMRTGFRRSLDYYGQPLRADRTAFPSTIESPDRGPYKAGSRCLSMHKVRRRAAAQAHTWDEPAVDRRSDGIGKTVVEEYVLGCGRRFHPPSARPDRVQRQAAAVQPCASGQRPARDDG
jgi:hypothetical protein